MIGTTGEPAASAMDSTRTAEQAAERTLEQAESARHARFGRLPRRIRYEDMTQEVRASGGGGAGDSYTAEGSWTYYSCLALDLGL